jgi:prophage DNA circulation protein
MEIQDLYQTLLTATFGGVPFYVIDTSQATGRRVMQFLYPGIDDASYQDLGASDGAISMRGLLVGDDYLAQMRTLRAVVRSPGPYTLVHPWLGSLQVIQAPGQLPKISMAANELRVARFEVQLLPFNPSAQAGLDTLSQLETQLDALTADAQNWLANVLSPLSNVLGAFGYAQSWLSNVAGVVNNVIASTPSAGAILSAATSAISELTSIVTAPSAAWAALTATNVMAVPAAIAGACTPTLPSAVAPGGATTAAQAADPVDTVNTLLAAVPGVVAGSSANAPGPALSAAFQAALVGAAVQAASDIVYTSQQQAQAQAAVLYAALDSAAVAAGIAAQMDPANAAPVWRDLVSIKAALSADLNSLIGRLPAVVTINIPRTMPAWLIAQYISGDDPDQLLATYQDIITRNNITNPALVPPGPLEVLNQ